MSSSGDEDRSTGCIRSFGRRQEWYDFRHFLRSSDTPLLFFPFVDKLKQRRLSVPRQVNYTEAGYDGWFESRSMGAQASVHNYCRCFADAANPVSHLEYSCQRKNASLRSLRHEHKQIQNASIIRPVDQRGVEYCTTQIRPKHTSECWGRQIVSHFCHIVSFWVIWWETQSALAFSSCFWPKMVANKFVIIAAGLKEKKDILILEVHSTEWIQDFIIFPQSKLLWSIFVDQSNLLSNRLLTVLIGRCFHIYFEELLRW